MLKLSNVSALIPIKKLFYINILGGCVSGAISALMGAPLTLDAQGGGSFKAFIEKIVLSSAQRAMEKGVDVSGKTWLAVENGRHGTV